MSEKNDRTSFELEVDNVRIAIEGTETYVNQVIKTVDKIISSVLQVLKDIQTTEKTDTPQNEDPQPNLPDTTISQMDDWAEKIAKDASISIEIVKGTFMKQNGQIVLYKWDVTTGSTSTKKSSEMNRVIAILHMFANDVVINTRSYTLDILKESFREVRLAFPDRDSDLKRNLQNKKYIRENKSKLFELTPLGVKQAKELLKGLSSK